MRKIKILVVCMMGTVIANVVAMRVKEKLVELGFDVETKQYKVTKVNDMLEDEDIIACCNNGTNFR